MRNSFLIGDNVYLRPLELGDVSDKYIGWLNDKEVCKYNSHCFLPYNRQKAEKYIETINSSQHDIVCAIIHKEGDVHIGNISLQNISFMHRNAEFAILLGDKKYWGSGYSKEASSLIIDHGFHELNLHRIYCGTSVDNIAMQKLAEYLGMKEEGRSLEASLKNGKYSDFINYYLLKSNIGK